MNARKIFLLLLSGLFAVLTIGALLFPMNNGEAADKGKASIDLPQELGPPNFDALALVPEKTSNLQTGNRLRTDIWSRSNHDSMFRHSSGPPAKVRRRH